MGTKIQALLDSRRFWVLAVVGGLVFMHRDTLQQIRLADDQINQIVMLVGSWVLGNAARRTGDSKTTAAKFGDLLRSRRFLVAVAGVAFVVLQQWLGESLPVTEAQVQQGVELLMFWILGDSLRETGVVPNEDPVPDPSSEKELSPVVERSRMGRLAKRRRRRNFGRAGRLAIQALADNRGDMQLAKQKLLGSVATWGFLIELAIKLLPLLLKIWQDRGEDEFELTAVARIDVLSGAVEVEEDGLRSLASINNDANERAVLQWLAGRHSELSLLDKGDVDDGE